MSTQTAEAWVPRPPAPDTFASRLRLLRLGLGDVSVQEAARNVGVPTPTWRKWEHGVMPQNMAKVVRQIHDATGVDMAWLMWGSTPLDEVVRPSNWEASRAAVESLHGSPRQGRAAA